MKKIIILLFLLLIFLQKPAFASEIEFTALSDVHISYNKNVINKETRLTQSIKNLQSAVRQINKSDCDFVVFAGDSLAKTDKKNLVLFAKIIRKLNKPYYVTVGNNDVSQVSELDKKEFFHLLNMYSGNKTRKTPCVIRKNKDFVFIMMDGVNQFVPMPNGNYKENELIWLNKQLKKYKNRKVVIIQHFPIIEPAENDNLKTHNADKYLELVSKHKNVLAIISGHYHEENLQKINGIYHISLPSLSESKEYEEITIEKEKNNYFIKTKITPVE